MTAAETLRVDDQVASDMPELAPKPLPEPWEPWGRGGQLLPDRFAGDAMTAFTYRLAD